MDCLVTKLKASVSDTSLRKLGELRLQKAHMDNFNEGTSYLRLDGKSELMCEALNGAYFFNDSFTNTIGSKLNIPAGSMGTIYISNGGEISVVKKYDITFIQAGNLSKFNLKDFSYLTNLKTCYLRGEFGKNAECVGDLSEMTHLSLNIDRMAFISFDNITGDIAAFKDCAIKNFEILECPLIEGDIKNLNPQNIEKISISGCQIGGTIESLVANLIACGRTSGTIVAPYINGDNNITFEGILLKDNIKVPSGVENMSFSWNADGTITWSAL